MALERLGERGVLAIHERLQALASEAVEDRLGARIGIGAVDYVAHGFAFQNPIVNPSGAFVQHIFLSEVVDKRVGRYLHPPRIGAIVASPVKGTIMKSASASVIGMTRISGPITSVLAAQVAARRKLTIRERVETFARFRPHGFLDCELFEFARDLALALGEPTPPESSARKRRTELCEENRIVASEQTRKNDHDQEATVFFAREHMTNPPPLKAREVKPSRFTALQETNARMRARIVELEQEVADLQREFENAYDPANFR